MNIEWCKKAEVGLPEPDAVVYLTVHPEVAAERGAFGGERLVKFQLLPLLIDFCVLLLLKSPISTLCYN